MVTTTDFGSELLFHFDSIVDLDIGVFKVIKEKKLANIKYIDNDIISCNDDNFFKAILLDRKDKNPLKLILNNPYIDSADSLLEEIYTNYYEDIIRLSCPLAPNNILCNGINNDFIHCYVICKNKAEKLYIKNLSPKIRVLEPDEINIDNFSLIYIKDIRDLIQYGKKLIGKNIYILNYPFNLQNDDGVLNFDVIGKIPMTNKFTLINPYINFVKPI